ncbi:MAG: oligosaccharide flippase family protein, partial [Kamptonema sp. SIO1D9]|nr:oligosaccharide flippase family protein [Kamptonema sp. SIO1D9]
MYQHILTAATRLKQHLLNSGQKLIRKTQSDSLQGFIARVAAGTFGIKVANAFLAYAISLLLARILGAEGFGSYAYALAWVSLLLIPAVLGLEGVITREVAVYQTKSNWSLAHGLLRWANQVVLLSALILGILAAVVIWVLTPTSDSQTLFTFLIAIISLPFAALARLRQSAMQAIQRIVIGQVPEMLVRPILLIILLGGLSLLGISLSTPWAMGMNTAATGIAFLVGAYLLDRYLPENIKHTPAEYRPLLWLRSALPMLLIGSLYIVNNQTDTVMLGAMKDSEAVGIYTV